jgi:hypothetical protein
MQEKVAGVSVSLGAANADATPCADGGHTNNVEPQLEDVPGKVALAPGSLRVSSFNPPWEAALKDMTSVPGSFHIVGLGLASWGCQFTPWHHFCLPVGGKWRGVHC